jgi:hypothetical protein
MIIIAYFSAMFSIATTYISSMETVTQEMSIAASNEAHFSFV